jgi:hypothetical protein
MKFVIFGPWALGCDIIRESPGMSPGLLVRGRPLHFSKPGERKFFGFDAATLHGPLARSAIMTGSRTKASSLVFRSRAS